MQLFLAFIRIFREYIVLVILAALSLLLMTNSSSAPVRVFRSVSIIFFATLQSGSTWAAEVISPRTDENTLRDVNVGLLEEVMRLRGLQQENIELRRSIGLRERTPYPLVTAEIVGKNLALGQNMITLDVGEDDSVRVNMPIISETGLVGKIVATSNRYAIGMLALHRDFRTPAKIKRSRVDGIIAYHSGSRLRLQNIWKTADVIKGDTIVTSEYSNVFPPEILIGVVTSIGPGEGGLFSQIEVQPLAAFSSLERVFVVLRKSNEERNRLERTNVAGEESP
ncbi:MAG: rod shape-determining protein MreC [Bacteroidia bacterium]|nr:rod shape-determining protein MreC [Bacteroidia bacterium]